MLCINKSTVFVVFLTVFYLLLVQGCEQKDKIAFPLNVPRGYAKVLEIEINDRLMRLGPFVGYYFKPQTADDLSRLKFVCFNERNFYTKDVPENTKLFKGDAILTRLPEVSFKIPAADRINPIYFSDAPPQWLKSRPDPKDEFVHFHSCYDSQGAVLTGYWIRHEAAEAFTYDMGGRVGPSSSLYHKVMPGVDKAFARIIEFDQGPK